MLTSVFLFFMRPVAAPRLLGLPFVVPAKPAGFASSSTIMIVCIRIVPERCCYWVYISMSVLSSSFPPWKLTAGSFPIIIRLAGAQCWPLELSLVFEIPGMATFLIETPGSFLTWA